MCDDSNSGPGCPLNGHWLVGEKITLSVNIEKLLECTLGWFTIGHGWRVAFYRPLPVVVGLVEVSRMVSLRV